MLCYLQRLHPTVLQCFHVVVCPMNHVANARHTVGIA